MLLTVGAPSQRVVQGRHALLSAPLDGELGVGDGGAALALVGTSAAEVALALCMHRIRQQPEALSHGSTRVAKRVCQY